MTSVSISITDNNGVQTISLERRELPEYLLARVLLVMIDRMGKHAIDFHLADLRAAAQELVDEEDSRYTIKPGQCPVIHPTSPLLCVMREDHDGTHNWGGIGPFTRGICKRQKKAE